VVYTEYTLSYTVTQTRLLHLAASAGGLLATAAYDAYVCWAMLTIGSDTTYPFFAGSEMNLVWQRANRALATMEDRITQVEITLDSARPAVLPKIGQRVWLPDVGRTLRVAELARDPWATTVQSLTLAASMDRVSRYVALTQG
jgi:hypothetical protein